MDETAIANLTLANDNRSKRSLSCPIALPTQEQVSIRTLRMSCLDLAIAAELHTEPPAPPGLAPILTL